MINLVKQQEWILEVKDENGDVLKLKLKSLKVKDIRKRESDLGKIYEKYKAVRLGNIDQFNKKINSVNFLLEVIGILIYDFDMKDFDNFTVEDLGNIRNELEKLSTSKKDIENKKKA